VKLDLPVVRNSNLRCAETWGMPMIGYQREPKVVCQVTLGLMKKQ
jgi:hypothetical protein